MEKIRIAPEFSENGSEESQGKHPSGHQGRNEERRVGVMQARLPETSSYFGIKRQPTGHQDHNVEGRVEVAIVPMPAVSQRCTDMMPSSVRNVERRVEEDGLEKSGKVPKLHVVDVEINHNCEDHKKQSLHEAPKPSNVPKNRTKIAPVARYQSSNLPPYRKRRSTARIMHIPATAAPQGRSRQRAKEGDECRNSNPST